MKPYFVLLALPLAGCISFGAKPPKQLLELTPTATVAPDTARTSSAGATLTVLYPSAYAPISGNRVPVYDGETAVAFVKDALLVDAPARQFQRLLSETIAAKTNRVVLDVRQTALDPGARLTGALLKFGVDPARMQAVVIYDAVLTRAPERVETRRFAASAPVAAVDPLNVGAALNRASNDIAAQVAEWVGN